MPEIDASAIADYRSEGVTVLRNYLDRDVLETVNAQIAMLFERQLTYLGLPVARGEARTALHENALALLRADIPRYIATARTTQELPLVDRILVSEAVVEIAAAFGIEFPITSTKPSVHMMADDLKIPNGYHKSPAHQDWRSIQGSLDNLVLWIPTTPVAATSNALEVVRGSHLLGLLPTAQHIMTPMVDDPRIKETDFEPLPVAPGDVIAFSSFLVHRTGECGDGLVRIALSTRFNNAFEPTYVQRGYATPYKYAYRLDLMVPGFPTEAQVQDAVGVRRAG